MKKENIIDDPQEVYGYQTPDGGEYCCYWGIQQRGAFYDVWVWDEFSESLTREGSFAHLVKARAFVAERVEALARGVEDLWAIYEQEKEGEV
jgi:hypothetical protein